MSQADQFRQYAEEALRWAYQSKTEKNKQALIMLARTWTQAAVQSEPNCGREAPRQSIGWPCKAVRASARMMRHAQRSPLVS